MMKNAYIIFNSYCFNFALMDNFNWSKTFGGFKNFVKESFIAENTIVALTYRDGKKKFSKIITKGILKLHILKYL